MATVPTFYLEVVNVNGQYRVDLIGENIPKKFLGIAFDLEFKNTSGEFYNAWNFVRFELGSDFKNQENILSLASFKQNPARLVFGLSFKQGTSIDFQNGKLASFYVSNLMGTNLDQDLLLHFERTVMSIFDKGRKDVAGVKWKDSQIDFAKIQIAEVKTVSENLTEDTGFGEVVGITAGENRQGLSKEEATVITEEALMEDENANVDRQAPQVGTSTDFEANVFDSQFTFYSGQILIVGAVIFLLSMVILLERKFAVFSTMLSRFIKKD